MSTLVSHCYREARKRFKWTSAIALHCIKHVAEVIVIWFDCFSHSVQIYTHQSCNCLFIMMIYSIYCWNAPLICLCHYNIGGRLSEFYMHTNCTYIIGNKFSAYLLFIILSGCVSCGWSAHKLNMWVERELRIPLTSGGGCGAARDARTRLPSMRRMGGRNRVDIHGCRELSSDLL